jgi:hypothetical protein
MRAESKKMRETRTKLLFVCIVAVCFMAGGLNALADEPQQSTTGPTPPLAVMMREFMAMGVPPSAGAVVIPGVPDYLWRHGCGPTAVGNVVGYYDTHGYDDLITGDANSQTNDVNQTMASGGQSSNPNPAGSEKHYEDYSRPEDYPGPLQTDDYLIPPGRTAHTDDCIGDYQDTSKSTRLNQYGWSWSSDIGPSFTGYVNQKNASYNPTYTEYSPVTGNVLTWAVLTNEINNNRPMVFLVDSDGDGSTDHFVAVVGYDAQTNQYGCHDSWAPAGVRWETFQGIGNGIFSIWGGWTLYLGQQSGPVTKWEQPPDTTPYGMDIRCDRKDGTQRVLADDFPCTTHGPITKVKLWGSWKNDIKGQIKKIHLSIHSDDPVGPGGPDPINTYSKPAQLLWSRDINTPNFSEALFYDLNPLYEWWWDPPILANPNGDHQIWVYEIPIDSNAFVQQGSPLDPNIYWLDVYVDINAIPLGAEFGWKTAMTHWNDDAVRSIDNGINWIELRYPANHPHSMDSIDLAFAVITGEPTEPEEPNIPNAKYIQWPDLTPTGIDIRVDDGDGVTRHIADDFPCTTTGLITDVHFWGSWKNDEKGQINGLVISFYSDDPCGPGGSDPGNQYSKPDQRLWTHTFLPTEFTETLYKDLTPLYEWWWDPYFNNLTQYGDHQVWKYDVNIAPIEAFMQEGSPTNPKVYWLAIEAWTTYQGTNNQFGWKTSNTHWNDDAVFATGSIPPYTWNELRYPYEHPYHPNSIDMAFAITTGGEEANEPKWLQRPDLSYKGVDVMASEPLILADDFNCNETTRITDITVWGSWNGDILPLKGAQDVQFTLSIHSDIPDPDPADPLNYSMPGKVLWYKVFMPGAFEVSIEKAGIEEGWWDPEIPLYIFPGDTVCWKYVFRIPKTEAFCQRGTPESPVVYWLDVQADPNDVSGGAEFGWKSSLDKWNDDAVWAVGSEPYTGTWQELRYPPGHPLPMQSIDLAFAIDGNIPCCQRYTDFDSSGQVDVVDLDEFSGDWLWLGTAGGVEPDIDCDGDVEFNDYAIFAERWLTSGP